MRTMTDDWKRLCDHIRSTGGAAVSFSGGVDSTVVLAAAVAALPESHIAVFADIPMISERQRRIARNVAEELGARFVSVKISWDDMPGIRSNGNDRCYICKKAIYSAVKRIASDNSFKICVDGENSSDRDDERPGRKAAAELGIVSPLKELGIGRSSVRRMFEDLRIRTDVQKETCMATRLPQGSPFGENDIRHVEECEDIIRSISGVRQIRMRLRNGDAELLTSPGETFKLIRNEKKLSSALSQKGISSIYVNEKGYEE